MFILDLFSKWNDFGWFFGVFWEIKLFSKMRINKVLDSKFMLLFVDANSEDLEITSENCWKGVFY